MPTNKSPEVLSDFFSRSSFHWFRQLSLQQFPQDLVQGIFQKLFRSFLQKSVQWFLLKHLREFLQNFYSKAFLVKVSKIISGILPKNSRHSLSDSLETTCRDFSCVHLRNSFRYYFSNSLDLLQRFLEEFFHVSLWELLQRFLQ